MATSLTLQNDASLAQGYIQVNGTTSATFTTSGITGNLTGNVTGSLTSGGSLTLATAQTATGTAVDFTGIPSWAKRITVMFNGVITSGISNIQIQIGSGSVTNTGYASQAWGSTAFSNVVTTGFLIHSPGSAVNTFSGSVFLFALGSNIWVENGNIAYTNANSAGYSSAGNSSSLSATLDRVRITTVNGTDTFDAGTINISFEG
jgi:hypothetical protein